MDFAQCRCEVVVHRSLSVSLKTSTSFLNACKSVRVKHTQMYTEIMTCMWSILCAVCFQRIILHSAMQPPGGAHWKLSEFLTLPLFFVMTVSKPGCTLCSFCFLVFHHHYIAKGESWGTIAFLVQRSFDFFMILRSFMIVNKLKPERVVFLCYVIKSSLSSDIVKC